MHAPGPNATAGAGDVAAFGSGRGGAGRIFLLQAGQKVRVSGAVAPQY
jgi:hypothetical protein